MRTFHDPGGEIYTRKTGDVLKTSPGQIAFETWAEIHQARPIWYDLPDYMKDEWERIARAAIDKHIENMAMDLVENS